MKIAIICDVLGQKNNGTSIAEYNLIEHMKKAGHDVRILCCDEDKNGEDGYYIVPTCNIGKVGNYILEKNGVKIAKRDKQAIRKAIEGMDVVQVETPLSMGLIAAKEAHELGIPISASFHCQAENITAHVGLMNCHLVNHFIYKFFYRNLYRYCSTVHYPTEFIRETFERECGHKTNAYVISNGVNQEFFEYVPTQKIEWNKFTIVCSGRYSTEKAQHLVIRAIGKSKYRDNIKLILAGSGPKERKLKKLAKKCNVDAEFHFYTRKELLNTLHSANLYVHTAKAEIEAIACTEAIVCGLVPVIRDSKESATKAFALDEKNLFHSIKELTEKIDFWYDHPQTISEYKENYKSHIKQFDQRECMKRMEQMLKDASGK